MLEFEWSTLLLSLGGFLVEAVSDEEFIPHCNYPLEENDYLVKVEPTVISSKKFKKKVLIYVWEKLP